MALDSQGIINFDWLHRNRGESKEGPQRQNNIIRSIAAASHANSTDGVVFPFPIKAQGFDWSLFLWPF